MGIERKRFGWIIITSNFFLIKDEIKYYLSVPYVPKNLTHVILFSLVTKVKVENIWFVNIDVLERLISYRSTIMPKSQTKNCRRTASV